MAVSAVAAGTSQEALEEAPGDGSGTPLKNASRSGPQRFGVSRTSVSASSSSSAAAAAAGRCGVASSAEDWRNAALRFAAWSSAAWSSSRAATVHVEGSRGY